MSGLAKRRLLLSLLCLGLALVAFWQALPPLETAGGPRPSGDGTAAQGWTLEKSETFLPGLERFTETLERPLFVATRTPATAAGDDPGPGGDKARLILGRYLFVGAVSTGGGPLLLLRDGETGPLLRLRAGDRLGDEEVRRIDADSLTIMRKGRERTIPLRRPDR